MVNLLQHKQEYVVLTFTCNITTLLYTYSGLLFRLAYLTDFNPNFMRKFQLCPPSLLVTNLQFKTMVTWYNLTLTFLIFYPSSQLEAL